MKSSILKLSILAFILFSSVGYAVVVSGDVYLEGQSNHANIKVRFTPTSGSAILDSTYTNALGYFQKDISVGAYTITYEKSNYQVYRATNSLSIIENLILPTITLNYFGNHNVSGNISGIWDGIYTITGDVTVVSGDSLIIESGSKIRFLGNYNFYVDGYLAVNGTETDSVYFTSLPANQNQSKGQWQGIDFNDPANNNSYFHYTNIEYSAYALYAINSSLSAENCSFRHNSNSGIYLDDNAFINVTNAKVYDNTTYGMYLRDYAIGVLDSVSIYNSGRGLDAHYKVDLILSNSSVNNNTNYGVFLYDSEAEISNSVFNNNTNDGIYLDQYSDIKVNNCTIENNTRYGIYFGHYSYNSEVINSTIRNNSYGIYLYYYSYPLIENNLIYGNINDGLYVCSYPNYPIIRKNTIYNNRDGIYFVNHGSGYSYNVVENNIISYNRRNGIRTDVNTQNLKISNNTICYNSEDGIENNISNSYTIEISNNIIFNNNYYGIQSNQQVDIFEYNDIKNNQGGEISNLSNLPAESWVFVATNANADSADIFLNICEEPSFVLSDTLDFNLMSESKCIDAGNPIIIDPDGTVSDIGALYRNSGNPHEITVESFSDQTVSLSWTTVDPDSLDSYNIYYKEASSSNYNLFGNIVNNNIDVTGLTNNLLYDFVVTAVYTYGESIYSPKVSEKPGLAQIVLTPSSYNFTVVGDTITKNLNVTNNGSRDMNIAIKKFESGSTYFDGNGDLIRVGDYSNLRGMDSLTVECWIKRTINGHFEFISKHYTRYSLYVSGSNYFGIYKTADNANGYRSYTSSYILPYNDWHHLAVTWAGNTIKYYADGVLVDEKNNANDAPIHNTGYHFEIGRRSQESQYFKGNLSEVRVWDVVRSAEEIRDNYSVSIKGNERGLVGYWPLQKDFEDKSIYSMSNTYIYGQTIIQDNVFPETLHDLPAIIEQEEAFISAGSSVDIPFKFYNRAITETYHYITPIRTDIESNPEVNLEFAVTYGNTVPSTPVHFIPVDDTGTTYNLIVTDANINGTQLAVGDEIGIYDDSLCVGAGLFDGNFSFVLTAYEKNVGLNLPGFTVGNQISYKIYDTSADLEATTITDYSIGDNTFGYGSFSSLSIESSIYKFQPVNIPSNVFKLVSFSLLPRYTGVETIFSQVDSLKIVTDDAGGAYIPEYGINSIGNIDFRRAYQVFSSGNDTVSYEGTSINMSEWDITVEANKMNSIAFISEDPIAIITTIPALIHDSISIVQDSDGNSWIPSEGINTIGNMQPGLGYQIALSSQSNVVFNYQSAEKGSFYNIAKKESSSPKEKKKNSRSFYNFVTTGLPYTIIIDFIEGLSVGDEIAVFDDETCVGAIIYDGSEKIALTAWEKSESFNLQGFTRYNEISLKIYSPSTELEIDVPIAPLNGEEALLFMGKNYSKIMIAGSSSIEETLPSEFRLYQNYPNPFNAITSIKYDVQNGFNGLVSINLYNIRGQFVRELVNKLHEPGRYRLTLDANELASGVYYYGIKMGNYKKIKKMIMVK